MSSIPNTRAPKPRACYDALGLPFDAVSSDEVSQLLEDMVSSGQPHYLLTAGYDAALASAEDPALQAAFLHSDLLLGEQLSQEAVPRMFRTPSEDMLCGTALLPLLLGLAETRGYRVFFFGSSHPAAQATINEVLRQYPGLTIAGSYLTETVPVSVKDQADLIQRLRDARPDVIIVSLEEPQQEKWLATNYRLLGAPVSIAVNGQGNSGERLARLSRRSSGGIKWLTRSVFAPHLLLKRYMEHTWALGCALLRSRSKSECPARIFEGTEELQEDDATRSLQLPARVDATLVADCGSIWNNFAGSGCTLAVDASRVQFLDPMGVGALIRLAQMTRVHGGRMVLVAPSKVFRRAMELMKATSLFVIVDDATAVSSQVEECVRERQAALQQERREKEARLLWTGEVTTENHEAVWQHLAQMIQERAATHAELAIDLSQVKFPDQSGLELMARLRRLAVELQVQLRFVNPAPAMQRTLRVARLESVILEQAA